MSQLPRSLPPMPIKRSRGLLDDPSDPMPRTGYRPLREPTPGYMPPWVDENGVAREKPLDDTAAALAITGVRQNSRSRVLPRVTTAHGQP